MPEKEKRRRDSGTPSPSMQPWWSTATSSVQCFLGDAFNQDEKELTSGEANDKEKSKSIKKILDLLLKIQPLGRHITLVSHKDIRNISR